MKKEIKFKCEKCGHSLKTPESIERGMGLTCYKKLQIERRKKFNLDFYLKT